MAGLRNMRSRRGLVVAAALVLVLAAGASAYFLFFTPSSPERLSVSPQPPSNQLRPTAGDIDGIWRPTAASVVGYRVREKLAGLPAASDAVGRTSAVTGSVRARMQGETITATDANFTADLTQLRSDEARRDNRIRTLGLETERYPTATFVSTAPIELPATILSGQTSQVGVAGDLTIHGVTRPVTIPMDVRASGAVVEAAGALTFPFSDFGMDPPNIGGFVTVESDPTLEFKLVLAKEGGTPA